MPKTTLSDQEFLLLLQRDRTVGILFQEYLESKKHNILSSIGGYWYPLLPAPSWSDDYDVTAVRKKAEEVAKKMEFMSIYTHALGLLDTLDGGAFQDTLGSVINAEFKDTLYSLHLIYPGLNLFEKSHHNFSFQQAIQRSLIDFAAAETDTHHKRILKKCCDILSASMDYYKYFSKYADLPKKKILSDLAQGKTRIFFTGRDATTGGTEGWHANNLIFSQHYLVLADRFDTASEYKKVKSGLSLIPSLWPSLSESLEYYPSKDTHRSPDTGIYIYKLRKPFSSLKTEEREKIFSWIKGQIGYEEVVFTLPKMLADETPVYTLPGKRQKYGNCRWVAKKQGVAGLIVLSAIELMESEKDSKFEEESVLNRAFLLQKKFKLFDRIRQIDNLIKHPLLTDNEKDQLIIFTFFRNFDPQNPDHPGNKEICAALIKYLKNRIKKSPEFIHQLNSVFDSLLARFSGKHETAEKNRLLINEYKKYLLEQGVVLDPTLLPLDSKEEDARPEQGPSLKKKKKKCRCLKLSDFFSRAQEDPDKIEQEEIATRHKKKI